VGFIESVLVVAWLFVLELLLSAENSIVLAMQVSRLPVRLQKRALLYGIWGAFIFRIIAVIFAVWLIAFWQFKLIGGAYLLHIAIEGLKHKSRDSEIKPTWIEKIFARFLGGASKEGVLFWMTVVQVELMDLAFSADSILASVGVTSNKVLIVIGGILGIITMRFVAGQAIKFLEK
jgi:YkoY family integral membrane protein